jgi:microcystin-dependent protein
VIGTAYGGDGQTTFALPNLAPVTPQGPGYFIAIYGIAPPTQ